MYRVEIYMQFALPYRPNILIIELNPLSASPSNDNSTPSALAL